MTSNEPAPDLPHRSTVDLVVLMLAGTVCGTILLAGAAVLVLVWRNPDADTTPIATALRDVLTTIVVAIIGLMVGRSRATPPRG